MLTVTVLLRSSITVFLNLGCTLLCRSISINYLRTAPYLGWGSRSHDKERFEVCFRIILLLYWTSGDIYGEHSLNDNIRCKVY